MTKIQKGFWYEYLGANKLKEGEFLKILSEEYILKDGILRQNGVYSETQNQTKDTFGFKWNKRDTYESEHVERNTRSWLLERYVDGNSKILDNWVKPNSKVLDAGCGSGYSALLLFEKQLSRIHYLGVDISNAVEVAAERFREKGISGEFIQADLMKLPFTKPTFDMIFSEGVLHHTDSTEKTFKYLANLLLPEGRFLFYVYRKKGAVREFTDDYIRNYLKDMDDQQAWDTLIPLTKLGKALGDLNMKIDVHEAIPYLGIPSESIDLQRLFYWYIFKAYYKPDWTIDEMNHVNFDWYRPLNCHRHTPEEIQKWCADAGLTIEHMNVQESGITVVAVKIKAVI